MKTFLDRIVMRVVGGITGGMMHSSLWIYEKISFYRASRRLSVEVSRIKTYPYRHRRGRGEL
jgi:hypothetical protein